MSNNQSSNPPLNVTMPTGRQVLPFLWKGLRGGVAFVLTLSIFFLATSNSFALTMTNGFYIVEMGNLNSIAGNTSGPENKLSITSGETGSGLYSLNGVNYKVRAGFQYVRPNPFIFKIVNPAVNFGTLNATIAVNRTSNLIVTNSSAYGYVVTAMEQSPLTDTTNNATIPDTSCDNGLCTPSTAQPWVLNIDGSSTTYGFGYNCTNISGTECPTDFVDGTYFRPFAASPSAAIVMSNANVGRNQTVQITYRVNVSQTQASGLYTDVITYIATPTF